MVEHGVLLMLETSRSCDQYIQSGGFSARHFMRSSHPRRTKMKCLPARNAQKEVYHHQDNLEPEIPVHSLLNHLGANCKYT